MLTPLFDKVILRPDTSKTRNLLYVPEQYRSRPSTCLVMSTGHKVNPIIKAGSTVVINSLTQTRTDQLNAFGDFMIPSSEIHGIVHKHEMWPIGKWVLVKRLMSEVYEGSIIIPENRRYQSLDAQIVRFGITSRDHSFTIGDVYPGDKIRLTSWEPHMIELDLRGEYHLLVKEEDLLYKIEN